VSAVVALRNHLLGPTLQHAVEHSAFYRAHLGEAWRDVAVVGDLAKLPILTKAKAAQHQDAMRCGPDPVDFGSVSSGTTRTGDRVFRVERCAEEVAALDEFYAALADARGPAGDAPEPPLVLHVLTPNHGLPNAPAPPNTLRFAWAPSRNVCEMIRAALTTSIGGRRITVARLSISILKQLTVYFLDAGIDPKSFGVVEIGTNAALVTRRWRRIVEDTWGARLFDNYSISEMKTPATEGDDGWYRFAEPPLVPEVVDPSTGAPIERGVGHLLLTGLYPFVQRTPLIRYATGDLVEVRPAEGGEDDAAYRFKGRVHQTLLAPAPGGTDYLLFGSTLEEIADDFADVARHVHPFEVAQHLPPERVGQPKVRARLRDDGRTVHVEVGTTFDPRLFPERAQALQGEVAARLLDAHPHLARRVADRAITLAVDLVLARGDRDWNEWFVKYLA
jgi:hypothetical protein